MKDDPRAVALRAGLEQLDTEDLLRVINHPADGMLLDGGNCIDGKYCPLAIALDIPTLFATPPPDPTVADLIGELGRAKYGEAFVWNQMHGTPGDFFRSNRLDDLMQTAQSILADRAKNTEATQ